MLPENNLTAYNRIMTFATRDSTCACVGVTYIKDLEDSGLRVSCMDKRTREFEQMNKSVSACPTCIVRTFGVRWEHGDKWVLVNFDVNHVYG